MLFYFFTLIQLMKKDLCNKFLSLTGNSGIAKTNWTREEEIRLLAGRRSYFKNFHTSKGVWSYLEMDTRFGFLFIRTALQMRFKYSNLCKDKAYLNEINGIEWEPDMLSIEERLDNLDKHDYQLSEEAISLYKQIDDICKSEWEILNNNNNSSFFNNILNASIESELFDKNQQIDNLTNSNRDFDNSKILFDDFMKQQLDVNNLVELRVKYLEDEIIKLREMLKTVNAGCTNMLMPSSAVSSVDSDANDSVLNDSVVDPIDNLTNIVSDRRELNYDEVFLKIYRKCQYVYFSASKMRVSLFSTNNRPDTSVWEAFIEQSHREGKLIKSEDDNNYRLKDNLITPRLRNDKIVRRLKKKYGKDKAFTLKGSHSFIYNNKDAISMEEWKDYINLLILENIIVKVGGLRTAICYKFA